MSLNEQRTNTRNVATTDQYDHEIRLVDAASPTTSTADPSSPTTEQVPPRRSQDSSTERRWSRSGLREELTRRKYARFQQGRYGEDTSPGDDSKDKKPAGEAALASGGKALERGRTKLRDKLRAKNQAQKPTREEATIDILYENQRGLFLCGLPYYSSQSLLNFDPAAWTSADFRESPVNITNAQVPDPTWVWAWPSWYVDMSHDVDEEGWTYSFSFRQGFAWHGTHPFFYSWVRQRRWLRKRVKVRVGDPHLLAESMTEAHRLNQDYFTIHSGKREASRGSSTDRHDKRSSFFSGSRAVVDSDSEFDEEITNVVALTKTMKATTVDRKKLDAFQNFVENGGDEVFFLPDIIQEIMAMFMYQNSRRQLLQTLEHAAEVLTEGIGELSRSTGKKPSSQRKDGLQKAVDAVKESISDLEYWSDVKVAERQLTGMETGNRRLEEPHQAGQKPSLEPLKTKDINEEVSSVQLRGIPSSAELDLKPGIMRPLGFTDDDSAEGEQAAFAKEKGKEKA